MSRLQEDYGMETPEDQRRWFNAEEGYYEKPYRNPAHGGRLIGPPVMCFINMHRKTFGTLAHQVDFRKADRFERGENTPFTKEQDSRFNAFLTSEYGGVQAMKTYLETGTLQKIKLPTIGPNRDTSEVTRRQSEWEPNRAVRRHAAAQRLPGHGMPVVNNRPPEPLRRVKKYYNQRRRDATECD